MRPSIILASLLFSHPASVIVPEQGDVIVSPQAIVQVICVAPDKDVFDITAGTAFRVGNGILLSVNHVTSAKGVCSINGKPISVWFKSPRADFSMLHGDDGPFITVDCGGFVKGRRYVAVGFARGIPTLTRVDLTATGETDHGMALLEGMVPVIPGMSGGVVLDAETGKAVGVINAENFEDGLSWSVELRGTPVCKGNVV